MKVFLKRIYAEDDGGFDIDLGDRIVAVEAAHFRFDDEQMARAVWVIDASVSEVKA